MKKEQRWKVVCQVCGRVLYNTQAKKRWDDLIVCPNDWEPKHPFLRTGHHYRHKGGGEGSLPYGAAHTGEPEDTFVAVCDVYSSMGVVGYGTTECAQVGTYNLAFSPLPSTTGPTGPENPII